MIVDLNAQGETVDERFVSCGVRAWGVSSRARGTAASNTGWRGMLRKAETHYRKLLLVNFANRSAEKLKAARVIPPEYSLVPGSETLSEGLGQGQPAEGPSVHCSLTGPVCSGNGALGEPDCWQS